MKGWRSLALLGMLLLAFTFGALSGTTVAQTGRPPDEGERCRTYRGDDETIRWLLCMVGELDQRTNILRGNLDYNTASDEVQDRRLYQIEQELACIKRGQRFGCRRPIPTPTARVE